MMIKCQKCGFENQMGSIFCRECGEKLNMDAIDPNKLQKDVNKEKSIKLAKKRIKGAISGGVAILVVVGFVFLVFPDLFPFGGLREYEEPAVPAASATQKYNAAISGASVGKVKYSYPEINQMLKTQVIEPLSELDSFAKPTAMEVAYDEEKNQPVVYVWISIKEKVPVLYTIHGNLTFKGPDPATNAPQTEPIDVDVKRLDIGRLPVLVSTHSFLNGFKSLSENEAMFNFFQRANSVEFSADGMTVDFAKGGPTTSPVPAPSSNKPSSATAAAALKGGSAAAAEKAEAARRKAEEEKAKKEQLAEERKRKAEEEAERKRQKEEERKQKIEEEKERKRQAEEERKRKIEEENERRRQEAEDRRREREERRRERDNNNYNSRNNRNSRNSRNNRW